MKKCLFFLLAISLLFACSSPRYVSTTVSVDYSSNNVPVGYDAFYNELSPYGRWIDYPGYGYVWSPNADINFRPYSSSGHWVYSNYGWTWVSDFSWGWAPFHYGRWFYEDGYGWLWLPGNEWAPAWVTWGQSGGYYGWAPIAPHVAAGSSWTPPAHYWNFVPAEHMTKVDVNNYVVNNTTNVTVVNNITKNVTIINNTTNNITNNITNNNVTNNNTTVYNQGPVVDDVEKATNTQVQRVTINQSPKPVGSSVSGNQLTMYRPVVQENTTTGVKPSPAKVEKYSPQNNTNPERVITSPEKPAVDNNTIQSSNEPVQPVKQIVRQPTPPPTVSSSVQKPIDNTMPSNQHPVNPVLQPAAHVVQKKPVQQTPVKRSPSTNNNPNKNPNGKQSTKKHSQKVIQ
jgi:hypothetical protein